MPPSVQFSAVVLSRVYFLKHFISWPFPAFFNLSSNLIASKKTSLFSPTMSQQATMQRLENNASRAEALITDIYSKIADIQNNPSKTSQQPEVDSLKAENDTLRKEIAKYKELLLIREIRNGENPVIRQLNVSTGSPVQEAIKPSANDVKVKSEPAAAEGPTKESSSSNKKEKAVESNSGDKSKTPKSASKKQPQASGADSGTEVVDVGRLDFRVGKIIEVGRHPDADSLYLEKIDVGEANPRTVVSGLVKFIPIEQMQDRMVVLLCNLKPAKMRGVTSEAMVMCASTPEKVEVLIPPPGAIPGDLVDVEGFTRNPDGVLNPKKKVFETVAPDLKTNDQKQATYKGVPWTVKGKGVVITESLTNVNIK